MSYRFVLFDLFGTVVHFKPYISMVQGAGTRRRSMLSWLREPLADDLPDVPFDDFVGAVVTVTKEIVQKRAPQYYEVQSCVRFQRALARLGIAGADTREAAMRLSLAHMAFLAEQTEMPPEHGLLLRQLARSYRLGLVSNFDHGPTAHRILARDGIDDVFDATVISADFGRRKPHPAIFQAALRQLDAPADEALYVGDTPADDVCGAQAAGLDVAWINDGEAALAAEARAPTYTIHRLGELREVLGVPQES